MTTPKIATFGFKPRLVKAVRSEGDDAQSPPFGGTDEDLEAINALTHRVMVARTRDNVMVRAADVISTAPLKNGLRCPLATVQALARLGFDTGVQANHDTGGMFGNGLFGLPLGRTFRTSTEDADGLTWARFWFAFPRTDLTEEVVERCDGGAISETSVSFLYEECRCSICGALDDDQCPHQPMQLYNGKPCFFDVMGPTEYLETSLVWQGMANDTRMRLAASRFDERWRRPDGPGTIVLNALSTEEALRAARAFGSIELGRDCVIAVDFAKVCGVEAPEAEAGVLDAADAANLADELVDALPELADAVEDMAEPQAY